MPKRKPGVPFIVQSQSSGKLEVVVDTYSGSDYLGYRPTLGRLIPNAVASNYGMFEDGDEGPFRVVKIFDDSCASALNMLSVIDGHYHGGLSPLVIMSKLMNEAVALDAARKVKMKK